MPKFLVQGNYTSEGAKGLQKDGGSKRRQAAEVLVKDVSGDPVEVRRKALVADFGALRQLTRNPVDRLVGKLK